MSNIIQFPGTKGKPAEAPANPSAPNAKKTPKTPKTPKEKAKQKVLAGSVLAIVLATLATNRIVYSEKSTDFSSHGGRSIASVDSSRTTRDSSWEKSVAESLASADVRGPASFNIGREVTKEEQLQLGTLNGVYTLQYSEDGHHLRGISLQDNESNRAYISPEQFFKKYGQLIDPRFKKAYSLNAPVRVDGRVSESYQVIDMDNRPVLEAHFEMDRHGRLISLQVTPKNQM